MTRHRYKAGQCSRCGGAQDRAGQRYCRRCHAAYQRERRPKHRDLDDDTRRRANARAYAGVYLRRGKLERKPCERCGADNAEMHHDDYSRPLDGCAGRATSPSIMGESFAEQVRRVHADVIATAEQRAAVAVELGVENLRVAIEREKWPWDRQVLEGHLRRIEAQ